MATKRSKPRTSGHPARRADQLTEAALRRKPRCQCEHRDGKCRKVARFRVSHLCTVDGCESAVHVSLFCAECKIGAVASHEESCVSGGRLRVRAL
jgi:hypothetical protein